MPSPTPHTNPKPSTSPAAAPPTSAPSKPSHPALTTTHPDLPPLPTQLTNFSLLPDLYLLLSRLSSLQPNAPSFQNTSQPTQPNQSTTTSSAPVLPLPIPSALSPTSAPPSSINSSEVIDPKALPTHIFPLKQRIQAAKGMVEGVHDVQRSLGMQEEEIRVLEQRCEGMRRRLGELSALAVTGLGEMRVEKKEDWSDRGAVEGRGGTKMDEDEEG